MGHGFRLMLQLVVTVAAAAVVARATESARRAFVQDAAHPPRHRADPQHPADATPPPPTPPAPHPFGPEPAIAVFELEASGELDDGLSPTDRLLALRHASDLATSR